MKWLRSFLRNSSFVHNREAVGSVVEALGVIDRFLDDKPIYPWEWDDFISWKSDIDGVEKLRLEIEHLEPLFFSPNSEDRAKAHDTIVQVRNKYAQFNGLSCREK